MRRRDIVLGGSAVLLSAALARAQDHGAHGDHGKMDHAAHAGHGGAMKIPLLATSLACEGVGEQCIAHCFAVLEQGDVSIAGCARSVNDMLAVNAALLRLAASGSSHLKAVAAAAIPVYDACEAECRKHEKKHAICKECGDACVQVVKSIRAL